MTDTKTVAQASNAFQFHDSIAERWEGKYRKSSYARRVELVSELLRSVELDGRTWLDAGCGSGTLSRWLAAQGCRVIAVDASAAMIDSARKLSAETAIEFQVIGSIENLPQAGATLDGVVCSSVLEYVGDPARCLAEFQRVLKPGGTLVVSVPTPARSCARHSSSRTL